MPRSWCYFGQTIGSSATHVSRSREHSETAVLNVTSFVPRYDRFRDLGYIEVKCLPQMQPDAAPAKVEN
jgi:hypothetical protein